MAKVRKRRTIGPTSERDTEPEGFPQWEHESSFTFEGEIERLGAISRNMSSAPRWARLTARGVALVFLLPIAFALAVFVVRLFSD